MYIIHLIQVNKSNLLQKISKFKYKDHLVLLYKINHLSIIKHNSESEGCACVATHL